MTRSFPRDPHWMDDRFDGLCAGPGCALAFPVGADIFYNPVTHKAFARACGCGETAAQRFYAWRSDEAVGGVK